MALLCLMFRISWFNIFQFLFYFSTKLSFPWIPNSKLFTYSRSYGLPTHFHNIFSIFLRKASVCNVENNFNGSAMRLICNKVLVVKNLLVCCLSLLMLFIYLTFETVWFQRFKLGEPWAIYWNMQQNRIFRRFL